MEPIHQDILETIYEKVNFCDSELNRYFDESLPIDERPARNYVKNLVQDFILLLDELKAVYEDILAGCGDAGNNLSEEKVEIIRKDIIEVDKRKETLEDVLERYF